MEIKDYVNKLTLDEIVKKYILSKVSNSISSYSKEISIYGKDRVIKPLCCNAYALARRRDILRSRAKNNEGAN